MEKEDLKSIENQVYKEIKENYGIPEKGLVAGQAVASLFYKYLKLPLNSVINDIDVFQEATPELLDKSTRPTKEQIFSNTIIGNIKEPSNPSIEGRISFGIDNSRGYVVVRSFYEEDANKKLINHVFIKNIINIKYRKYFNFNNLDNNQIIVNSFDINCCAVGFDIETGSFYYSDGFLRFLDDFKLRIQSTHTPFHSILRLYKKIKDLNCQPDIEVELDLLRIEAFNSNLSSFIIGERFFNLYNSIPEISDHDYFKIEKIYNSSKYSRVSLSAKWKKEIKDKYPEILSSEMTPDIKEESINSALIYAFNSNYRVFNNMFYHIYSDYFSNSEAFKNMFNSFSFCKNDQHIDGLLYSIFTTKDPLKEFDFEEYKECQYIKKTLKDKRNLVNFIPFYNYNLTIQDIEHYCSQFFKNDGSFNYNFLICKILNISHCYNVFHDNVSMFKWYLQEDYNPLEQKKEKTYSFAGFKIKPVFSIFEYIKTCIDRGYLENDIDINTLKNRIDNGLYIIEKDKNFSILYVDSQYYKEEKTNPLYIEHNSFLSKTFFAHEDLKFNSRIRKSSLSLNNDIKKYSTRVGLANLNLASFLFIFLKIFFYRHKKYYFHNMIEMIPLYLKRIKHKIKDVF